MWELEWCHSMVDAIKGQRIKSPALHPLFHFHPQLGLGFMGGVRMVGEKGELPAMAPFLSKCYDIVDNPATNGTVSWGKNGDSFVIWDPNTFSHDLLPKYFKHSNLSSFVRQLNTYGFHKADHDRLEFANKNFIKDHKHLLKQIIRRKPGHDHPQLQQSEAKGASVNACLEVGKYGLEEEVERLKRDKDLLRQELIKLRQHQQNTENQVHDLRQSLHGMEQNQQQMLSFLAMAVQSPGFLSQLMKQQNPINRQRAEITKKRRFPALEHTGLKGVDAPTGQIVKYQPPPPVDESMKTLLMPTTSPDEVTESESMRIDFDNLLPYAEEMSTGSNSSLPVEEDGFDMEFFSSYLENLLSNQKPDDDKQVDAHNMQTTDSDIDFDFLMDGSLNLEPTR
ncbi:putative transcription factor HSF-type-DNA-binding family [Dioscorea sansibarensis]